MIFQSLTEVLSMKTIFWKFKKPLALFLVILVTVEANAATAVATVSANIVPMTSVSLSGPIILSNITQGINKLPARNGNNVINSNVSLSTEGINKAMHKVTSSRNIVYDITILSPAIIKDTTGREISIEKLQLASGNNQPGKAAGQAYLIDGAFSGRYINAINTTNRRNMKTNSDPFDSAIIHTVHFN